MKKKILLVASLFLFIGIVNADAITYDLCKEGCTYSSYDDIINNISTLDTSKSYDFVINIKDNATYETSASISVGLKEEWAKSTFKVIGENGSEPTIKGTEKYFYISPFNYAEVKNVNYEGEHCIVDYHNSNNNSSTKITNSNLNCDFVSLNHKAVEINNVKFDGKQFFTPFISENVIIKNSNIKGVGFEYNQNEWHPGVRFDSNNVTITNSTITSDSLWDDVYSTVTIKDSTINLSKEYNSKSDSLNITNSNIKVPDGIKTFGLMNIDKTTINVNSNIGLTFVNGSGTIKNSKISGAKVYGIEYVADNFANKYNQK
mgnify:CR=1 FL=1